MLYRNRVVYNKGEVINHIKHICLNKKNKLFVFKLKACIGVGIYQLYKFLRDTYKHRYSLCASHISIQILQYTLNTISNKK